jgi:hypothetical protein
VPAVPAIASRRGDHVRAGGGAEMKHRITRGPRVEDKTVYRIEIALFDPSWEDVEKRSALFPAIQVMDNGDNGHGSVCFQPPVQSDERRVAQFILQYQIGVYALKPLFQAAGQVVGQAQRIPAHGKAQQMHAVAIALEMLDQLPIIQVSPGERVDETRK